MINEFKFGYNAAPSRPSGGVAPAGLREHHPQPERIGGQHRHRGTGRDVGLAIPGGLVRVNSAGNGRSAPVQPVLADVRRLGEPSSRATTS